MSTEQEIRERLDVLRRQSKGISSMIEMMEKGTPPRDLARFRAEKLDPISQEIRKLEGELAKVMNAQC